MANYVTQSTHETKIIADLAVLVWCILEGKQLYLPRHIRWNMGWAHYIGNLAFPCMITELATEDEVVWLTTDERLWQTASPSEAGPSASASVAPPAPPTPAASSSSQPLYCLIHRLVEDIAHLERHSKRCYENIKRQHPAWDTTIEEPDTPSDHSKEEEERDAPAHSSYEDSFHSA
ncbi:hypothetical protein AHAS_Ahas13G0339000 [Arachis hypogaea]